MGDENSLRATLVTDNSWLPITTTGATAIIPGNTPPAQISTQGEYTSPWGCRGTFGSFGVGQLRHLRPRVPRPPKHLNLVPLEHLDHPFPRRRLNLRRSSDPVGLPAGDQNFRKRRDQNFRNPQT